MPVDKPLILHRNQGNTQRNIEIFIKISFLLSKTMNFHIIRYKFFKIFLYNSLLFSYSSIKKFLIIFFT